MAIPRIVGFGGTMRDGSTSERLARAVLNQCASAGAQTTFFGGAELGKLPHFSPETRLRTAEQTAFVDSIRTCDGVVIASPGYHGAVSGLVKNAIDLLEDLRDDGRAYFADRPVALVVSAAGWQAANTTMSGLRDVVHAMRGWVTPYGLTVNTAVQNPFCAEGKLSDACVERGIRLVAAEIMNFVGFRTPQASSGRLESAHV